MSDVTVTNEAAPDIQVFNEALDLYVTVSSTSQTIVVQVSGT
jgi:hypothetical protein